MKSILTAAVIGFASAVTVVLCIANDGCTPAQGAAATTDLNTAWTVAKPIVGCVLSQVLQGNEDPAVVAANCSTTAVTVGVSIVADVVAEILAATGADAGSTLAPEARARLLRVYARATAKP
jgi:hypothetical protein